MYLNLFRFIWSKSSVIEEQELVAINEQIESLEERLMNKETEAETYQRRRAYTNHVHFSNGKP